MHVIAAPLHSMPASTPRSFTLTTASALALLAGGGLLGGCASSPASSVLDKPLEWLGMKKPDVPAVEAPPTDRKVTLRIHAGDRLNTDANDRSLSAVVKIYKLKEVSGFLGAPLEAFKDASSERIAFGSDIVDAREIVMTPGQRYEVVETLPNAITYLGVVTQFRAPADNRWRFAFATRGAEKSGITLGLHGCAMSVAAGEPVQAAPEMRRLAGVHCR